MILLILSIIIINQILKKKIYIPPSNLCPDYNEDIRFKQYLKLFNKSSNYSSGSFG